jgi:hypothetical protein
MPVMWSGSDDTAAVSHYLQLSAESSTESSIGLGGPN